MTIFSRPETTPYFNIAAEEFLLKHFDGDAFTLWRNEPAIIVGKHQNTHAEIHLDVVQSQNIPVIRRLSGGGAVFHDLGNICFTFVKTKQPNEICDFSTFTKPIIELLQQLGVNAEFSGRNDLTIGGKKFSGNAEATWNNRVLHHGTLLFSSKLTDLSQALRVHSDKFQDKAVKSVQSRVTNIEDHLHEKMSVMDFMNLIEMHILKDFPNAERREFSKEECEQIEKLAKEKYQTWDWNFGQSPTYTYSQRLRTQVGGSIEVCLVVKNGNIEYAQFFGDFFEKKDVKEITKYLIGMKHERSELLKKLEEIDIAEYFKHITKEEFLLLF
ncbi:MAG: lipoate--protein ligase [Bacteroidales bacterium]|jgi:lipoate-protein ligase A|nr:lipoate--protein ligase [Bacteroidales bacterium]